MFGKKRIYLDNASATPVLPRALDAVYQAATLYANPGGIHADAVAAKKLLEESRGRIASELACKAREVIFTSGLTESNALALIGVARALERVRRSLEGTHWLVASVEHASVLECFSEIERLGGEVSYLEFDGNGIITPQQLSKQLRPETVLVSVGWANNETGVVQQLKDISRTLRAHEKTHKTAVLLHSDAGQAPLYISPQVHTLGVDLFAVGSGKLYGTRGIGCLYVSGRAHLTALVAGGGQERGLRGGTEDPALAAGFAEALGQVSAERSAEGKRLAELRAELGKELVARIPEAIINGSQKHILPHMLNISIPGKKSGEYLALQLDRVGISVSTKSACREGEADSRVVKALGGPDWRAKNTIRFSLGRDTKRADIKRVVEALTGLLAQKKA